MILILLIPTLISNTCIVSFVGTKMFFLPVIRFCQHVISFHNQVSQLARANGLHWWPDCLPCYLVPCPVWPHTLPSWWLVLITGSRGAGLGHCGALTTPHTPPVSGWWTLVVNIAGWLVWGLLTSNILLMVVSIVNCLCSSVHSQSKCLLMVYQEACCSWRHFLNR